MPSAALRPATLALALVAGLAVHARAQAQAAPLPPATAQADSPRIATRDDAQAADAEARADGGQVEPATETAPAEPTAADAIPAERADADPTETRPAPQDATGSSSSTAAEDDFEALYGDATEGGTPVAPAAYDPWERYNRQMHRFNNAVDARVARPLAQAYVRTVPAPVRGGVSNFFSNLGQPVSAVNALLQGKPRQAAHSLGRFVLNSTLGIGGVLDPASAAKLENRSEDFGQTLGVWGWRRSRYVELPLFGPRTLRDVVGMAGDAPLSPLRHVERDLVRAPLQGLQLVDVRTQLLSTDALREGAADDYALVRDAWSQRRDYQIVGDRDRPDVPDTLRDQPTVVPVDAMPVELPGG